MLYVEDKVFKKRQRIEFCNFVLERELVLLLLLQHLHYKTNSIQPLFSFFRFPLLSNLTCCCFVEVGTDKS
ncbi:hypothetical protein RIF29_16714 [Crotalaria pallida]|uniref:Uncharacterized protein n=1 Tax=Crotalaria pallida TaxID=3830 RepID=A0AAN9FLL4_CROPI